MELAGAGVALWLTRSATFLKRIKKYDANLEPGGVLLQYTHGNVEAHNPAGDVFGEQTLRGLLQGSVANTSEEIADYVLKKVKAFVVSRPAEDDLTLVVVKRTG